MIIELESVEILLIVKAFVYLKGKNTQTKPNLKILNFQY